MKEQIKKMAIQAGMNYLQDKCWMAHNTNLERFAEFVRQEEREICAKLCDDLNNNQTNQSLLDPSDCAVTIRLRNKK